MVLFLRNERFKVNSFIFNYQSTSVHAAKHVLVALFNFALPPPRRCHCRFRSPRHVKTIHKFHISRHFLIIYGYWIQILCWIRCSLMQLGRFRKRVKRSQDQFVLQLVCVVSKRVCIVGKRVCVVSKRVCVVGKRVCVARKRVCVVRKKESLCSQKESLCY